MTEHEIQAIDALIRARIAQLRADLKGDGLSGLSEQARIEAALQALRTHPDDPDPARE